ncbi:protein Niban 1a [Aulostomus maculatus]
MGISASSLLDDSASSFIRGEAEAKLREFRPYYTKQFFVSRFSQVEDDLEQQQERSRQLLREKEVAEEAAVLYEEGVLYFDETRKWRDRYVVVRANYCLECHDSLETFVKGIPPRYKLLPTGGTVVTTEENYMGMVDKCFPDDSNVKEDFAPPLSGMPGPFPVYLRLPYRRDSYFCFRQQAKQAAFLAILSDCIRHQNQDFLKKQTCEVQAFLKAIQQYRQDRGQYQTWDMLIGSDARVMANLVMEQLLPSLERDMLPRLKAKKTEKKWVWFATVEAAYILIQEHLFEGLSKLKEDCRAAVQQQEVTMRSDVDQILDSRRQLEDKVSAKVLEAAEKLCSESVQPYLGSVLDELMEPISSGFEDGRQLSEITMDAVCQDFQQGASNEQLKEALASMARPNLLNCYQKIGSLQEKLRYLQERFGFSNVTAVIHSAQIDLQQLMENAAFTFEQLVYKAIQDNPDNAGPAIEKAKHRVLKQYDYDSSSVRKRTFQEALVSMTLPFIKKNLASTCKPELQGLELTVYADHSDFIHVENVYESVLLQILDQEVNKVVKEAASLKKHNLFTDSRDLVSQSSLSSPTTSTPDSPAVAPPASMEPSSEPQPPSPLVVNGLSFSPKKEEDREAAADVRVSETLLGDDCLQLNVLGASTDTAMPNETQDINAAAETVTSTETPPDDKHPVPEVENTGPPEGAENAVVSLTPAAEEESAPSEAPTQSPAPAHQPGAAAPQRPGSPTREAGAPDTDLPAPSGGEAGLVPPGDVSLDLGAGDAEAVTTSDPSSLDVSVGSDPAPSDVESVEEMLADVSASADLSEDDVNPSRSPAGSDDRTEDQTMKAPPSAAAEDASGDVEETSTKMAAASSPSEAAGEETPSSPTAQPVGSIKEIRDLVVEVFEVEEVVQRYPSGVPAEE